MTNKVNHVAQACILASQELLKLNNMILEEYACGALHEQINDVWGH